LVTWAQFHNDLIQLKFNPNYFMQNNNISGKSEMLKAEYKVYL